MANDVGNKLDKLIDLLLKQAGEQTPRKERDTAWAALTPEEKAAAYQKEYDDAKKLRDVYTQIGNVREANLAINEQEREMLSVIIEQKKEQLKLALDAGKGGADAAAQLSKEIAAEETKMEVLKKEKEIHNEINEHGKKYIGIATNIAGHMKAIQKDTAGWVAMMGDRAADKALAPFVNKFKEVLLGLNEAEKGFERMTGLGEDFSHQIREGYEDLRGYGVTVGEMAETQGALTQTMTDFTMTDAATRKSLGQTGAVLGELGVSANDYALGLQTSTKMLGQTAMQAEATSRELVAYAKDLGLAPGQLSAQFAQMGPQLAKFGDQGVKAFKDMAHISKITGMEMSKVLQITNKFDTFEGAAEQAGKLNAALGGNFVNAMDLMMTTDPAERFNMIRDSILDAGLTFDDMSYYQKNFYKESLGLSDVGDLAMMLSGNMDGLTGDMGKTNDELIAMKENSQKVQSIQEQLQALVAEATPVFQEFADVISWGLGFLQEFPIIIKLIVPGLLLFKVAMVGLTVATQLQTIASLFGAKAKVADSVATVTNTTNITINTVAKESQALATSQLTVAQNLQTASTKRSTLAGKSLAPVLLAIGAALLLLGLGILAAGKGASLLILAFHGIGDAAWAATFALLALMIPFVAFMGVMAVLVYTGVGEIGALIILAMGIAALMLGAGMALAAAGMSLFVLALKELFKVMPMTDFMLLVATFTGLYIVMSMIAPLAPLAAAGMILMAVGLMAIGTALLMMVPTMMVFNMLINGIGDLMDNTAGLKQVADDFVRIGNAIRTIPPVRTLALSTLMTNTAVASNATGVAPAGAGGAGGQRQVKVEISLDATATKEFLNGNTKTFIGTEGRDAVFD